MAPADAQPASPLALALGGVWRRGRLGPDCGRVALLMAAGLVLGLALNGVHPRRLPLTLATVRQPGVPVPVWGRITPVGAAEAGELIAAEPATVVVDVREQAEFEEIHARGAISLPYGQFAARFPDLVAQVPRERPVLVYDDGTARGVAWRLATRLVREGYDRVLVLEGGVAEWVLAGLPVEMDPRDGLGGRVVIPWRCPRWTGLGPRGPRLVAGLLRWGLGGVFLYAAAVKLLRPDQFAELVLDYRLLPLWAVNWVAWWLPSVQLLVGLAAIAGRWVRASALLMSGMMGLFVVAVASTLLRGLQVDCGCFTVEATGEGRTWLSLGEELGLLAASLTLWRLHWPAGEAAATAGGPRPDDE